MQASSALYHCQRYDGVRTRRMHGNNSGETEYGARVETAGTHECSIILSH